MTTADFKAKLTTIINAEPDPDVAIAQFWQEFLRNYDVLAATPDPTGVITLCISTASDRDIERITYPWETIEADFLDVKPVSGSIWPTVARSAGCSDMETGAHLLSNRRKKPTCHRWVLFCLGPFSV